MSEFQLSVQICLNKIDGTEISTGLLPRFDQKPKVWETCMFYANGDSNVVEQYTTEIDAINGHNRLVEHELNHKWARDKIESDRKFTQENPELIARWAAQRSRQTGKLAL